MLLVALTPLPMPCFAAGSRWDVHENHRMFEKMLDLAAEVQSALRMAVEAVGGNPDNDQSRCYLATECGATTSGVHPALHADR